MKAKRGTAVAFTGLAVLCVLDASVQGQTRNIFQRISTELRSSGYTRVGDTLVGWLDEGESATRSVWLSAGQRYLVAAACDRDCSDVDLQLFSPAGIEVDSDLGSDDEPIVYATPARSGTYRIRVSMPSCSVDPCEYFAGVFRQ